MEVNKNPMYATELHQYLSNLLPSDVNVDIQDLLRLSEQLSYGKNEVIFAKGKIPHKLLYLVSGHVIAIQHSRNYEQVTAFYCPKELICPLGVFNGTPTSESYIVLEPCIAYSLSQTNINSFQSRTGSGYTLFNAVLCEQIALLKSRLESLSMENPSQRYETFLKKYKGIPNLVKSELIASYLNISNSTLSRIKEKRR